MTTITLKPTTAAHKEAVARVAETLNARTYANKAIGDGLATPGMRAAFGAEISRKAKAAQPSLKAARAELANARTARITARVQGFYRDYSYLTNGQIAVIHAHEGWAGR